MHLFMSLFDLLREKMTWILENIRDLYKKLIVNPNDLFLQTGIQQYLFEYKFKKNTRYYFKSFSASFSTFKLQLNSLKKNH